MDLPDLSNFHFIRPGWLLLLLPVGLLFLLRWLRQRREARQASVIVAPHLLKHMIVDAAPEGWLNPIRLLPVVWVVFAVSLAGPTWKQVQSPLTEDRAALVIALGLPASMNATDIQPSRLLRVQQKVRDLLAERHGSETGLIVYAGSAHMVLPLTDDPEILRNYLDAVRTDMMPLDGNEAAEALRLAEEMLADVEVPSSILFITDGIDEKQIPAFEAHAASSPDQVLLLAAGTAEGGPIPTGKNDFVTAADGQRVISRLDEKTLQALEERGGVSVTTVTVDDSDVRRINSRIQHHLSAAQSEDADPQWEDYGYYLMFVLVPLWMFWYRQGWMIQWCLVVFLLSGLFSPMSAHAEGFRFADLWLTGDQQGRYYFDKGDYAESAERFEDPLWKGVAYYAAESFEGAIEQFSKLDTPEGYFNLGNAYAHAKKYLRAVKAYEKTLALQPGYEGAKENRDLVQSIIDMINAMSDPNAPEASEMSQSMQGDPDMAEGAEETTEGGEGETLDLEALQAEETLDEMWLRRVQPSPAAFLKLKFSYQLQEQQAQEGQSE